MNFNLNKNAIFIFILLFIFSCSGSKTSLNQNNGDMFVTSLNGDASYLNPLLAADTSSAEINAFIFNGLLKYDKDLNLVCDLAESFKITDNGLTVLFKIKKNIKWHDGVPFTSKDVEFTYKKLIDPQTRTPFSSDYLLVKKFNILDDYSFSVSYDKPFAPILESWGIGIIPEHLFKNEDINTSKYNRQPVGTGPYIFKQWKTDQKIELKANPDYFEGKPKIAACLFRIIPDQAVQFLELRNESIDQISLTTDQWNAYNVFFKHYDKYRYPSFSFTFLGFNLQKEPFKNIKFRQAINYALNKKDIIEGIFSGMAKEATGIFPPNSWAYKKIESYEYNPGKALALLKEIGFSSGKDGYLYYNNTPFEITVITHQGNKARELSAQIIQEQLKQIGLKINIRILEWSTFINQYVNEKNFDALILGWSTAVDPDQYSLWHSEQTQKGQYNFMSYKNNEVDKLLIKARGSFNKNERIKMYHKIQDIMREDPPCIFLYYPDNMVAVHKRFKGVELAPAGIGWNFRQWYVDKKNIKYASYLKD